VHNLIDKSLKKLKQKNITTPELDLRILLKYSSFNNKDIFLNTFNPHDINIEIFNSLLSKRLKKEPISKIINRKYFWKNEFFVNNYVLDPRPETELIIEEVKNCFKNTDQSLDILDIGTGSGCLAISLAREFKNSKITAIDVSNNALEVAKKNVLDNNCENNIELKLEDYNNIYSKYDLIVSNPPYISDYDYENLDEEVKNFEPKLALQGGKDGLNFYRNFANIHDRIMKNKSIFICEIGYNQLNSCIKIFKNSNLMLKKVTKDLQNIDRTLTFFKI